MKSQKRKRTKRTSRLDRITAAAMQTYAHVGTEEIFNRRDVLVFEATIVEQEISALQRRLADARAKRARIEAETLGLGLVVGKR